MQALARVIALEGAVARAAWPPGLRRQAPPPAHPGPPAVVVELDGAHGRVARRVPQAEAVAARQAAARDGDVVPRRAAVAGPRPGEGGEIGRAHV